MIRSVRTLGSAILLVLLLLTSAPSVLAGAVETMTNEWIINTGASSDTCPALAPDGIIFFGTDLGELWAVHPDGTRKWIFKADRDIKSSPALANDGTIYFGSRDYNFYAVAADGKKKWQFKTGAWIDASPALGTNGDVYFGSWDKTFYALDRDGKQSGCWISKRKEKSSVPRRLIWMAPIYFGSHDGKLYALSSDGRKQWEFRNGRPDPFFAEASNR